MAKNPHLRMPRWTTAILVGRGRVTLRGPRASEAVVLKAAGSEFAPGELEELLRQARADRTISSRAAVGFEPGLEFFTTERRPAVGRGSTGSVLDELAAELGSSILGRELQTPLPEEIFGTAMVVPGQSAREVRSALLRGRNSGLRLISTTHAVLLASQQLKPTGEDSETAIRVVLGEGHGLAFLTLHGVLVARHFFEFSGDPVPPVTGAVRRLLGVARETLGLEGNPEVVLHLEGESFGALAEDLAADLELRAASAPPVAMDADFLCAALALSAWKSRHHVNLLQSGVAIHGVDTSEFPVLAVLATAAVVCAVGSWMYLEGRALDSRIRHVEAGSAADLHRFGTDVLALRDQRDRATVLASAVSAFGHDRVRWAPIFEELPNMLPEGMTLQNIEAAKLARPLRQTGMVRACDLRPGETWTISGPERPSFS